MPLSFLVYWQESSTATWSSILFFPLYLVSVCLIKFPDLCIFHLPDQLGLSGRLFSKAKEFLSLFLDVKEHFRGRRIHFQRKGKLFGSLGNGNFRNIGILLGKVGPLFKNTALLRYRPGKICRLSVKSRFSRYTAQGRSPGSIRMLTQPSGMGSVH